MNERKRLERVTLDEVLSEHGATADVFDLAFADAVLEWCERTGGYIAPFRDPSGDKQEYIPGSEGR